MKIVVTGSLGNISKPLAKDLVQKGHEVIVISSKAERQTEIEAIGAKAAIGSMQDAGFLADAFKGADIVYVMETMGAGRFSDHSIDVIATITQIGRNYKEAIEKSGVKAYVLQDFIIDRHPRYKNIIIGGGFSGHGWLWYSRIRRE